MLSRVYSLNGTIESWGFAGAAVLGGTLASLLGARGVFAASGVALRGRRVWPPPSPSAPRPSSATASATDSPPDHEKEPHMPRYRG